MKVDGGIKINIGDEQKQAERLNQGRVEDNLFNSTQTPTTGDDGTLFFMTNSSEIEVPPATIGALLSTFVDDVIAMFSSDENVTSEPDENDNPDEKVAETSSTTSFTA